jgi:hypothetical protein
MDTETSRDDTAAASHKTAQSSGSTLRHVVARALDAMAPMLDDLLADRDVSAEAAMHVVVMDPAADPRTSSFDDAILTERSYGNPSRWEADYAWYARAKARLAWREQMTLRTLFANHADRLRPDDIRVEGAVREGDLVVAASGAQAWYDHAIASTAIALIEAGLAQARHADRA